MKHEFKIIGDLYKENDNGENVVFKKDVLSRGTFRIKDVIGYTEIWGTSGKKLKNQCRIYVRDVGEFVVREKYDNVKKIIDGYNNVTKVEGFKDDRK